jgi:hypothetical protein
LINRALDDIFKLTDVSFPAMLLYRLHRSRAEFG